MDGDRFDSLTRVLGSGQSRRSLLKGLGATALGAVGLSRAAAASAKNGTFDNSVCVNFCNAAFSKGRQRYECQQAAVRGAGPCIACGGNTANYCNGVCISSASDVNNCGGCGHVCSAPANAAATCTSGICGFTCASGYQPDGAGGCSVIPTTTCPEPSGSYGNSCYGISESCTNGVQTLSAQCQEANFPWGYYPTSINVNTCQAQGYVISNCNGTLTCGNC